MNSIKKITDIEMKARLSTLWIFVLFNIVVRDIHELFRSGLLQEMMTGTVNGTKITEELMLMGAIPMETLIFMILLSRVFKRSVSRWPNIVVAIMGIAYTLGNGANDLDDVFFTIVEIIAMSVIVWCAWTWRKQETEVDAVFQ
ncbi:MAG: hypothetical protein JKY42_02120 [Flavobacteriales bacterium]|nr:hypothetical protein [Flavobacteriales bacterium]